MFEPTNSIVGLLMTLIAALGWATQNNAVLCTRSPPGIYHFHFVVWRFLWSFAISLILGSSFMPPNKDSMFSNLRNLWNAPSKVFWKRIGATFVAGFTDMLFQIFILGGVSAAGLSNSIPLQIGLATIFGAFFTYYELILTIINRYIVEKKGILKYLIPGVCFNILAVISNTITYHYLSIDQKKNSDDKSLLESGEEQTKVDVNFNHYHLGFNKDWHLVSCSYLYYRRYLYSLFSHIALLAMFWGPSTAIAGQEPFSLNSYVILFNSLHNIVNSCSCIRLVSHNSLTFLIVFFFFLIIISFSMRHPFIGQPTSLKDLVHTEWKDLFPGMFLYH